MYGFSKYDAQGRYDEWNATQVKLKLNKKTDADILARIDKQRYSRGSSVQGAIKALIRAEIARGGRKDPNTDRSGTGTDCVPHPAQGFHV